ncbi:MAG: flavin reductase family protein [Ardenticatenaceae bacterium]
MPVDIMTFKKAMSQFATGCTIVTTTTASEPIGITVNAFCSVSLDPLLVMISIAKPLYTHSQIMASGVFAVNILSLEQMQLADLFAGRLPESGSRFEGLDCRTVVTGSPILPGCLSWVDCQVRHAYDAGDHTLFIGEVAATGINEGKEPLLYFQARWGQLDVEGPKIGGPWPTEQDKKPQ